MCFRPFKRPLVLALRAARGAALGCPRTQLHCWYGAYSRAMLLCLSWGLGAGALALREGTTILALLVSVPTCHPGRTCPTWETYGPGCRAWPCLFAYCYSLRIARLRVDLN